MTREFKAGQQVAVKIESLRDYKAVVPQGTVGSFDHYDRGNGWGLVRFPGHTGDGPEGLVKTWDRELEPFTPPSPAPAPLDPSKVKAGDTVTLERGVAVVKGEVSTAYPAIPDSDRANQHVAFSLADMGGSMFAVGGDHPWTLTAHQPAPKALPTANGSIVIRNRGYGCPEFHLIADQWRGARSGNAGNPNAWADGWTLVRDAGADS
jgi:hypothetical protein